MKKHEFKILVVDDDIDYAGTCAKAIAAAGYNVSPFGSAAEALEAVKLDNTICLVLTDLKMPEKDGIQLLREVKAIDSSIEVIIMTGYGTIESAVHAIKEKAADYITKPFDKEELLNAIQKVYQVWRLQNEVAQLRQALTGKLKLEGYVFKSPAMAKVYDQTLSSARCDCSVFITGESGTGKELIARAIHNTSRRAPEPFVPINCGALSRELIESELFGYRKGAFTGADSNYEGLFVAADGGTLFLDEIVEMQQATQVKLLRAIQERSVRPVGSVQERTIDVRFVTATNSNVKNAVLKKLLREDLYYRLNVIPIEAPPLRKMRDEIGELLNYFVEVGNKKHEHRIKYIDDYAMKLLVDYSWPGNIREVENLVERFFAEAKSDVIMAKDIPQHIAKPREGEVGHTEAVPSFSDAERELVIRALREARGNKSRAAEILGISRPRLYKKIDLYKIEDL